MRTKVVSVRLKDLISISDKAFKAVGFDGSTAILPKSQVFFIDTSVSKSDAYWISEWLVKKSDFPYSSKKTAWFDSDTGQILPDMIIEHHVPSRINPVKSNLHGSLVRHPDQSNN